MEPHGEVAELRRENQRLELENHRLRDSLKLKSKRLRNLRRQLHCLLGDMSDDDASEPESTVVTTSSDFRRGHRAGKSSYEEVVERVKYAKRFGEQCKFTQSADLKQHIAEHNPERLPKYVPKMEARSRDFHDPWHSCDDTQLQASVAGATGDTVWPERLTVKDLMNYYPSEQFRLAPLIKQMTLKREMKYVEFRGGLSNLDMDLKVEDVWLGWLSDKVTPFATVAFRTRENAQQAVTCLSSENDLVSEITDWHPHRPDADRSESGRRVWFKNCYLYEDRNLAEHLKQHLQEILKLDADCAVCVISYWDSVKKVKVENNTDTILSGYVEFEDERDADALMSKLEKRKEGQEELTVLRRIRNVATPIAFKRDRRYEKVDS